MTTPFQKAMNERLSSLGLLYSLIEFVVLVLFYGSGSSAILLSTSAQLHDDFQSLYYLMPAFIIKLSILLRVIYLKLRRQFYAYLSVLISALYLFILGCDLIRLHRLEHLR
jgi:hypothetical protein